MKNFKNGKVKHLILFIPFIFILSGCAGKPNIAYIYPNNSQQTEKNYFEESEEQIIEKPDAEALTKFKNYLNSFKPDNPEAIKNGLKYYKAKIAALPEKDRDRAFLDYKKFYEAFIIKVNGHFYNNQILFKQVQDPVAKNNAALIKFRKQIADNGMSLLMSEGNYYIGEKPGFLLNSFSNYLSVPLKEFLAIRSKELSEGFSEDAGLVISFEKLSQRVRTWEKFLAKYPDFVLKKETEQLFHLYLNTFLTGMDNSHVFINSANVLKPELKKIYTDYSRVYPDSKSGKLVSRYFAVLKKSNFKLSKPVLDFYKKNGINTMMGIQPPER